MKIENGNATSAAGFPAAAEVDRQKRTSNASPAGADQVNLGGGLSQLLNSVNGSGSSDPRVAQLRSLYASGNYRPDSLDISRSLVSSLLVGG